MKKVLLVQCPCSFGAEMPPLGLGYLSSFLKKNHVDVSVLDLNIAFYHLVGQENQAFWKSNNGYCWYLTDFYKKFSFITPKLYDEFVERILSTGRDIFGFSIQNTSALFTLEVIKRIKMRDPSKMVVLGGSNCYNISGNDNDFRLLHGLHEFADAVVVGEGEETFLAVLRRWEAGEPLNGCRGLAFPWENRWMMLDRAQPITNLDDLPFCDFDAFQLEDYTDKSALPVMISRGCVMRCVFCTDTYFWMSHRYRSPGSVLQEVVLMKKKYGKQFVHFNDSLINGHRGNLSDLCDLLVQEKVGVSWGGNCRVDKRCDLSFLRKMKKAGCRFLTLGLESGSDKILKAMRKGFTIDEAEHFIIDCKAVGIDVTANWIVGFPGETEEDFSMTVSFIERHADEIQRNTFSTLTVNQFSYLEKHRDEFGIELNGAHLGLWSSKETANTIDLRDARLRFLEEIEAERRRDCSVVRQSIPGDPKKQKA
jgi:radical SAM superfamily enzyme YgiQ (UPF0313 family)